jgi:hypothetical protein
VFDVELGVVKGSQLRKTIITFCNIALVHSPLGRLLFVFELGADITFRKHPVDSSLRLVHSAAPGLNLFAERLYIWDSPFAEALPG